MALFLYGWILGILTLYILQSLDVVMQLFSSWASVLISKNNATIGELQTVDDNQPRIGFQTYEQPEEYFDEEDYEE